MEEEKTTTVIKGKKRRSSILKMQLNEQNTESTTVIGGLRKMVRRVSFADVRIVKEFDKDLGIEHSAQEELIVHNSDGTTEITQSEYRETLSVMEPPIQPSSQQTPSKPSIFNIDELSPRLKAFYNVKENVDYETLLNTSVNQAVGYRNPTEIVPNSAHINWPIPILPAVAAENEKCDALTATVEDVYEASSMDITDEGYSVNVRQLIQSSKSLAADDMEITGEESTMEELPITGSTGELNRTFAIEDALDGNRRYQSSPKRSVGISFMGASANCTQQLLNLLQPTSAETDGDVEEEAHEQKNLRDISTVSNNSATGDLLNILRGTAGVKELTATTVPTVLPNVEISIIPTVLDEITNKSSMSLATTETGPTLNLPSPESNVLPSKSIEVGVTDITDIDMAPDFSINNVSFETAPTEKLNLSSHQTSETVEMVPVSHPEPNESARATIFTASQIPLIRKIMETERLPVYPELSAEFSLKQWTVNSAKLSSCSDTEDQFIADLDARMKEFSHTYFQSVGQHNYDSVFNMNFEELKSRFGFSSEEELWRNCQNEAIAEFCNAKTRQIQEITEALEAETKKREAAMAAKKAESEILAKFAGYDHQMLEDEEAQLQKELKMYEEVVKSIPDYLKTAASLKKLKTDAKTMKESIRKIKLEKIDLATNLVTERLDKLRKEKHRQPSVEPLNSACE